MTEKIESWCIKCRVFREINNPQVIITAKSGGFVCRGKCPVCGAEIYGAAGKEAAKKMEEVSGGEIAKGCPRFFRRKKR